MITKMAATSIYGQTLNSKIFSRNRRSMILKLRMHHEGRKLYLVCINDNPGLTLTFFMARSVWSFCSKFFPINSFWKTVANH